MTVSFFAVDVSSLSFMYCMCVFNVTVADVGSAVLCNVGGLYDRAASLSSTILCTLVGLAGLCCVVGFYDSVQRYWAL